MSEGFDLTTLGRNLARARLLRGLTRGQAAARAGVTEKMYTRYEQGFAWPSVARLRRICVALRASADAVLSLPAAGAAASPGPEDTPELRRLLKRLAGASPERVGLVADLLAELEADDAE